MMRPTLPHDSDSARHWRSEIVAFHAEILRRYAPSMRPRLDLRDLWRIARTQAVLLAADERMGALRLPQPPPFDLDDLLAPVLDTDAKLGDAREAGGN